MELPYLPFVWQILRPQNFSSGVECARKFDLLAVIQSFAVNEIIVTTAWGDGVRYEWGGFDTKGSINEPAWGEQFSVMRKKIS